MPQIEFAVQELPELAIAHRAHRGMVGRQPGPLPQALHLGEESLAQHRIEPPLDAVMQRGARLDTQTDLQVANVISSRS